MGPPSRSIVTSTDVSDVVRAIAPARGPFMSTVRLPVPGTALDGFERVHRGTRIRRLRPNQPVVRELLQNMRRPAGDASARENRREFVSRESQTVKQRRAVEIDVGVDALVGL